MSGVLHPVGPEPARTYWLRRAALLAVLAVLVIGFVALVSTIGRGSGAAGGPPAQVSPTSAVATDNASPPASGSPTASPTSSAGASGSATPVPPTAPRSSTPSSAASSAGTSTPSSTGTAPPSALAVAACDPAKLRPTLIGDRTLKVGQDTTYALSLINGSGTACRVTVSPATFELKIYSGTDRIWSTKDCASAVKTVSVTLAPEKAVEWKQVWNGRRSASGCKNESPKPRAGIYWTTAQLTGAKPVQVRSTIA